MRIGFVIGIFLTAFIAAAHAAPEKRVALIIGNNAYTELNPLHNPGIDAERMARLLAERGFDTVSCDGKRPGCFDVTRDGLSAAIAKLAQKAKGADLAFVFYAGHGIGAAEGNMLVPVDADVDCERQQVARGVLVDEVLEALAGAKQKIVVLDACRDNPMGHICPPATKAKLSFRDFNIPDAGNFLLVSSTKPGQVAADGDPGAHSPFAQALFASFADTPNVHFHQVFDRVSKAVIERTSKGVFTQIPEMLIRGGAPEACLAGEACGADPQAAALAAELDALKRDRARDQELGETAKDYLAQLEKQRGKAFSEDERRRELATLKEAARSLAARNDNRGERALEKLKAGDMGEARRLFQEDLDAEEAEERAQALRREERRKKAAASARRIAALSRWTNLAEAVAYYKRAVDLDPGDAQTWDDYARAALDAGRMDDAKTAFEQAAARAAGEDADSIRYWAMNGRGVVLEDQGNLSAALQSFRDGLAIAERLFKADPSNVLWQRNLSVSHIHVGDVLAEQGDQPGALKSFRGSQAIFNRLANADPGNADWQRDLAVAYSKVGDMLVQQGNPPEALQSYRDSLAIAERLAKADPNSAARQHGLSTCHERVGKALVALGNLPEAHQSFYDSLAITERLAKADPTNAGWQHALAGSHEEIGVVFFGQGNLPEALKSHSDSLAIRDRLAKIDPGNAGWQRDLSMSYLNIGDVLMSQGNLPDALKSHSDSLAIRDRLAQAEPANATWQHDLSVSYAKLAGVYQRQGDKAQAKDALGKGKEIMVRMTKLSPDNALWRMNLGRFEAQIAALDASPHEEAQARAKAAFAAGDFTKAAAEQAKLAAAIERAEREKAGKLGRDTATVQHRLAWYRLFDRDFSGALEASGRAIALRPDWLPAATNKAHALLFLGRTREARVLYLRYKGQRADKDAKLWEEVIREDFEALKKRGVSHRRMAEIEALLAQK